MSKTFLISCFLLTILISYSAVSQQHKFTIHLAGGNIGEIKAELIEKKGVKYFNIVSEVNFKVLWKKYNRKTDNKLSYNNDNMIIESYSGIYMNNELEDSAYMKLNKSTYSCYRYPDKNFSIDKFEIDFPAALLYFKEPVGVSKIYSERFLEYCPLVDKGDHKYVILLPNGKENIYTYKNGLLTMVYVDRTWFNLEFRKVE